MVNLRIIAALAMINLVAGCSQPKIDAPADLLGKKVPLAKGGTAVAFQQACRAVGHACGIEAHDRELWEDPSAPPVDLVDETLERVLSEILARKPSYRVVFEDGVLNLRPNDAGPLDPLAAVIEELEIRDTATHQAIGVLLDRAGIRPSISGGMNDFRPFGRVTIHLKNVSVRQGLNRIAAADGKVMWIVGLSRNPDGRSAATLSVQSLRPPVIPDLNRAKPKK